MLLMSPRERDRETPHHKSGLALPEEPRVMQSQSLYEVLEVLHHPGLLVCPHCTGTAALRADTLRVIKCYEDICGELRQTEQAQVDGH